MATGPSPEGKKGAPFEVSSVPLWPADPLTRIPVGGSTSRHLPALAKIRLPSFGDPSRPLSDPRITKGLPSLPRTIVGRAFKKGP